ncbi:S1C family serine protease [Rhodohalobacter sp.]|uniref:S1C family serine protease n=1 Tax=Rhodohalobacter sp. TaxID=1974210 RepID=UPI002ACEBA59|nr:trypsin-like peptidase domain-containing protein [Rhodohalobacter sp.]MDZ7758153.1 trypsin-like peptidase domain-containing protein [Rhodohalobacter sp.]
MKKILRHIALFTFALFLASCQSSGESDDVTNSEASQLTDSEPFSAAYVENSEGEASRSLISPPEAEETDDRIESSRVNAITRSVEKGSGAVVSIMATEPIRQQDPTRDEFFRFFFGDQFPKENSSMGSGFIISEDGLVVTNQHVVGKDPSEIMISMGDGSTFEADLVGFDELTDIALIRIQSDQTFPYLTFTDSDSVIVGEWSIALGNPFGLFDDGRPSVTVGVVSAKNRDFRANPNNPRVFIDMIQTDAAINRGNSGGPLLNSNGEVIGMNTFIYTGGTSAGFVGLSFAIPSNRIEKIISQLLTSGVVMLDYDPGMEFTSMTEQLIYRYRLPYVQGLLVTSVNKNGPAFECGILPGDVIVRIGDERVMSEMHAWALLRDYDVGDEMQVELLREGDLYQTEMMLRQKVKDNSSNPSNN